MLRNTVDNLQIECLFSLTDLLTQTVGLFKPVSDLVVEVDFFSEDLQVVLLDVLNLIWVLLCLDKCFFVLKVLLFGCNLLSFGIFI